MFPVEIPFHLYHGLDGRPLDSGYINFGQVDQNPLTAPLTVYWDAEGTQPAAQPLRTQNGYVMRAGTPAMVFVDAPYSLLVRDKQKRQVYFARDSRKYTSDWYIQNGDGAVAMKMQDKVRRIEVTLEEFGGSANGVLSNDTAIWKAIQSIRANPVSISDGISGATITAYTSGTITLGRGVYSISAGLLNLTQDLGLIIRGAGSRRSNNAVLAPTTLLVSGASSSYGIRTYGNGARGLTLEDLDVCYESASFTGDILDVYSSPGVTANRVFFGTYGTTALTRNQTARSLLRATYDEFMHFSCCVFDGAVDGVWFDDARDVNPFGGSMSTFDTCVFYDFTGSHMRHDGARTRSGLRLNNCSFNPISVNCVRALNLTNIEGLAIDGGICVPSVGNHATAEWVKLSNCTGYMHGMLLDDLSNAGTLDGQLDISDNRVYCLDGFVVKGGVIAGRNNEFSKCTNGWTLSPTYELTFDLGPDLFKSSVTRSYNIPADSLLFSGRVSYSKENDASASKFLNTSARVTIANMDGKTLSTSAAAYAPPITDTGRVITATSNAAAQTITLPVSVPGTRFAIFKPGTADLTVQCAGGNNFYRGVGAALTKADALAADVGGSIELEAYGIAGWRVKSQVGTWAYT